MRINEKMVAETDDGAESWMFLLYDHLRGGQMCSNGPQRGYGTALGPAS